jgi:hypothetical protein
MRTLVQRLKRLWNTPVEFYGVDRPEPQAGPWHGLLLFVVLLVILGLLWLIRYLPERTYLVQLPSMSPQGRTAAGEIGGGHLLRKCWRGLDPEPLQRGLPLTLQQPRFIGLRLTPGECCSEARKGLCPSGISAGSANRCCT